MTCLMKTIASMFLALIATLCAQAQIRPLDRHWNATIKVVDETGRPVPSAEVQIIFSAASPQGEPIPDKITGLTSTNGVFLAAHTDRSVQLDFIARKSGYYPFTVQHFFGYSEEDKPDWSPAPTLILKRIRNPIPMYARTVSYFMPTNAQPVGFDLARGDWVVPYGKGKTKDIVFVTHFERRSDEDYDYKLTVSFSNRGDGIQGFELSQPIGQGSALRSPHEAPESGYEPQLVKVDSVRPGHTANNPWNEKTNYLFRVRTVFDENGHVKSALYGKIYGDFNRFRYYLNPAPNDRNIEFDPKRNLLKGLKGTEQVREP